MTDPNKTTAQRGINALSPFWVSVVTRPNNKSTYHQNYHSPESGTELIQTSKKSLGNFPNSKSLTYSSVSTATGCVLGYQGFILGRSDSFFFLSPFRDRQRISSSASYPLGSNDSSLG